MNLFKGAAWALFTLYCGKYLSHMVLPCRVGREHSLKLLHLVPMKKIILECDCQTKLASLNYLPK